MSGFDMGADSASRGEAQHGGSETGFVTARHDTVASMRWRAVSRVSSTRRS